MIIVILYLSSKNLEGREINIQIFFRNFGFLYPSIGVGI